MIVIEKQNNLILLSKTEMLLITKSSRRKTNIYCKKGTYRQLKLKERYFCKIYCRQVDVKDIDRNFGNSWYNKYISSNITSQLSVCICEMFDYRSCSLVLLSQIRRVVVDFLHKKIRIDVFLIRHYFRHILSILPFEFTDFA